MIKNPMFTGLIIALTVVITISAFFTGLYITNLDSDKNVQFNFNNAISKSDSQIDDNPVVAEVNEQKIRLNEINDAIKAGFSQGQMLDGMSVLDMIVIKTLLLEEAQNRNIVITISDAEEQMAVMYSQSGFSIEQFEEKLQELGTTYEKTLENFREELIINKMITDEISNIKINISDKEAQTFFDENIDEIKTQTGNGTVFDDVSSQIKTNLLQQKQQKVALDFIEDLENKATVIIYQDELQ